MVVFSFHLALAAFDAFALSLLWRRRDAFGWLRAVGVVLAGIAALAFGGMVLETGNRYYGSYFTLLGLTAWGVFAHGIPLLVIAAVLLRRRRPALAGVNALLALLLAAAAYEGFWRGPRSLEVTRHVIESAKLHRPWRVAVVADLQVDDVGEHEREALRRAFEAEPDLVLFPGDYVQAPEETYPELVTRLNALLRDVAGADAPPVFAVEGNVDREGWEAVFDGLDRQTFVFTAGRDLEDLRITGLSFTDSFDTGLVLEPSERFHLVFGHAPDFALGRPAADLAVAGHTHGGQVRVPGVGPLLTLSRVPRHWAAGRTALPAGGTLVVSRGVGMERGLAPRVRFFCPPEVVILDLVPSGDTERRP